MTLTAQAQLTVDAFTAELTADQRSNFTAAIQSAPVLAGQINAAVASNDLRGFALLAPGTNAGGQYGPDSRVIELPASILTTRAGASRFDPGELTFALGHEVQHAVARPIQEAATQLMVQETNRIGRSSQEIRDYTAVIGARLAAHRQDEAEAHIAGFNATVSMVHGANANQTPSLDDLYRANPGRMRDFIAQVPGNPPTFQLRSGLSLNADMTMSPTPANTESMGRHFYDQPANQIRIGSNGDSDYQNFYAAGWVGFVAQVERAYAPVHAASGTAPELRINLGALGLNEVQLERNGVDLGSSGGRQPYIDIGTTPPTPGHFDHTLDSNLHIPIPPPGVAPTMNQPGSPEHGLYLESRSAVERMEVSLGRGFSADSEKLTQAAALAGYAAGMDHIDHAVISTHKRNGQTIVGENLIVVQGALDDPAHVRASVRIDDALARTPAEHVQKITEAQEQRQGLEARLATPLPAQRDPSQPDAPGGPRLS